MSEDINKKTIKLLAPKLDYPDRLNLCTLLFNDDNYSYDKDLILASPEINKIIFNRKEIKANTLAFHHFLVNFLQESSFEYFNVFLPIYQNFFSSEELNQKILSLFESISYYSMPNDVVYNLSKFNHLFNEQIIDLAINYSTDKCFAIEKFLGDKDKQKYINEDFVYDFANKYRASQQEGIYYLNRNNILLNQNLKELLFDRLIEFKCKRLIKNLFPKKEIASMLLSEFNYFLVEVLRKTYTKQDSIILDLMKKNIEPEALKEALKGFVFLKKNQRSILNECLSGNNINFTDFLKLYNFFKPELLSLNIKTPYKQLIYFYQTYPKKVRSILQDRIYSESDYFDTDETIAELLETTFTKELSEFEMLSLTGTFYQQEKIVKAKTVKI